MEMCDKNEKAFQIVRKAKVENGEVKIWLQFVKDEWREGVCYENREAVYYISTLANRLAEVYGLSNKELDRRLREEVLPEFEEEFKELFGEKSFEFYGRFNAHNQHFKERVKKFTNILEGFIDRTMLVVNTMKREMDSIEDWLHETMVIFP